MHARRRNACRPDLFGKHPAPLRLHRYRSTQPSVGIEHQLRHDHLPLIAPDGVAIFRLRVLSPTDNDGRDPCLHATVSAGYRVGLSQPTHDAPAGVLQLESLPTPHEFQSIVPGLTLEWLDAPGLPAHTARQTPDRRTSVTIVDRSAADSSWAPSTRRRVVAASRRRSAGRRSFHSPVPIGPGSGSPAHESWRRSRAVAPHHDLRCCHVDSNCHRARRRGETRVPWRGARRATSDRSAVVESRAPTRQASP